MPTPKTLVAQYLTYGRPFVDARRISRWLKWRLARAVALSRCASASQQGKEEPDVTNVTRLRCQVQTCECLPSQGCHSVEVGLVIPLPRSAAGRSYGPCDQAGTRPTQQMVGGQSDLSTMLWGP
eukprot:352394-Chlamydomonas_euryale.AAC.6